jgi:hypothetical protein
LQVVAKLAAAGETASATKKARKLTKQGNPMPKVHKTIRIRWAEGRGEGAAISHSIGAHTASIHAGIVTGPTKNRRWPRQWLLRRLLALRRQNWRCHEQGDYANAGGNFSHDAHR